MINKNIIAGVLCLFTTLRMSVAQDTLSDDDVFDAGAFDDAVSAGKAVDEQNKLTYLPGVFFVGEAREFVFRDTAGYGSDLRFYGKTFLKASKADIGSIYLGCNFDYFLYAGANNARFQSFYQYQKADPAGIKVSLSEIHFSFDIKKRVFIRIGKQLLSWGACYFWSPTDFVNQQQAQPTVVSVVDMRAGKPGLRIHFPIKSANLFLFTDFSGLIVGRRVNSLGESIGQAWHLDFTLAGINVGTNGYVGRNRPARIGFDATGNVLATDLYGEFAFSIDKNREKPGYAFSIGATRVFGQEKTWTGRAEFFYNDTGYGDTRISLLAPGSFTPFYSGRCYAYAEIAGTKVFSSVFGVALYGFVNMIDRSYSPTLQGTFRIPGIVPFALYGRYFGGPDDREFSSAYGGRVWQAGARLQVEF
jgi:hypothetical protein